MNLLNLSDCIYGEFVHTPDMDSRRARQPQRRTRAADVPRCLPWDYFRFARQNESNPQFSGQVGTPTPTDTAARSCGPRARVAPIAISSFSSGLVPCARPGLQLFQPRSPSGPIPTSGTTDLCRTDGWPSLPRGGIPLFDKYDELPRECFESRG